MDVEITLDDTFSEADTADFLPEVNVIGKPADVNTFNAASVSFSMLFKNSETVYGTGEFEGVDINEDGLLQQNELTDLSVLVPNRPETNFNLDNLDFFGTFDLSTGMLNAETVNGSTKKSYLNISEQYDNGGFSVWITDNWLDVRIDFYQLLVSFSEFFRLY